LDPITSLGSNSSKKKREEKKRFQKRQQPKNESRRPTTTTTKKAFRRRKVFFKSSYLRVVHELGVAVPGGDCHDVVVVKCLRRFCEEGQKPIGPRTQKEKGEDKFGKNPKPRVCI